tara:strand:- start:64 stop:642 length:579 start_codon:yes stop_codon:yes gene_type:complete
MKKYFYEYILKAGALIGAFMVFVTFIINLTSGVSAFSYWQGLPFFVVLMFLVSYFARKLINSTNVKLIQKESFILLFGLIASSTFIYSFYKILLFSFNPDFAKEYIDLLTLSMHEVQQLGMGITEETLDQLLLNIEDSVLASSLIKTYFNNLLFYVFLCFILSFLSFFRKGNKVLMNRMVNEVELKEKNEKK